MIPQSNDKEKRPCSSRVGFVLMELLIVVAVVAAIIAAIMLPALSGAKQKAQRINCVNNLKQTALAFRIWETDNADRFPMQVPNAKGGSLEAITEGKPEMHFRALSNELGSPKILVCPSDNRGAASSFRQLSVNNISYFVGVDAKPANPRMLLAGDRNLQNGLPIQKTILELPSDRPVSWTSEIHTQSGNVSLTDGSVQQCSAQSLNAILKNSEDPLNRVQLPVLVP